MPYTTVVAGTTITASWGNASVRDQVVTPFATAAARTSAVTSPVTGMLSHRADFPGFEGYDGTGWVASGQYTVIARKAADESLSSSTVLQNDDDLVLAVRASATYELHAYLSYTSNTTADFKIGWTGPAGYGMFYAPLGYPSGAAAVATFDLIQTDPLAVEGAGVGTRRALILYGIVTTAGTAGSLQLQWAQNTSDAGATALKSGSFMTLRRMS